MSSVSLRDIVRCAKLFFFFVEYLSRIDRKPVDWESDRFAARDVIRRAIALSLAHCYHNRLTYVVYLQSLYFSRDLESFFHLFLFLYFCFLFQSEWILLY